MPKYYCDYCDTYLTHDSPSVRKTHCTGRKHKDNVKFYYEKLMAEQAQALIDTTTALYKAGKMAPKQGVAIPPPSNVGGPVGPPMMPPNMTGPPQGGPPGGLMPPPNMGPGGPMSGMMMGPHGPMPPMMGMRPPMMGPMPPMMGPMGPMGPMRPQMMNAPPPKNQ